MKTRKAFDWHMRAKVSRQPSSPRKDRPSKERRMSSWSVAEPERRRWIPCKQTSPGTQERLVAGQENRESLHL